MPETHVTEDQIALAAYYIWLTEGRPTGLDEAHWHRARTSLEAGGGTAARSPSEPASAPKATARQAGASKTKPKAQTTTHSGTPAKASKQD
jgi:hypothetical protein